MMHERPRETEALSPVYGHVLYYHGSIINSTIIINCYGFFLSSSYYCIKILLLLYNDVVIYSFLLLIIRYALLQWKILIIKKCYIDLIAILLINKLVVIV